MAVPEGVDSGASPSLFSSLRSFWSVVVAVFHTRLDLATTELEELGAHTVQLLILSLAALLAITTTIFFFLFFLCILAGSYLLLALGLVTIVCVIVSIILVLIARQMILTRPKLLAQTLAELRRDVESLKAEAKPGGPKP